MEPNSPSNPSLELQDYLKAWTENACSVLKQATGDAFAAEFLPQEELPLLQAVAESGVWIRMTAAQGLTGEQAFLLPASDAVRLAQMLSKASAAKKKKSITEKKASADDSAEFTPEHGKALEALFGKFADAAAKTLEDKLGGQCELKVSGSDRPNWSPGAQAGFRLACPKTLPILVGLHISEELASMLGGAQAPTQRQDAAGPPANTADPSPKQTSGPSPAEKGRPAANVDLLMDVELEVTLRFGESQLQLQQIIEMDSGSIVELDRQISEPVELLVGGKPIALGEVVIVNGNYGVRIIQTTHLQQTAEFLAS